jgi:hypothetical protein
VSGAPSSITGPASSPLWVLPSEELDRGCEATGRGGREGGRGVAMGRAGGREAFGPAKTRVHYRGRERAAEEECSMQVEECCQKQVRKV